MEKCDFWVFERLNFLGPKKVSFPSITFLNNRNCTTCPYIEHGRNQYTFHSTGETYHIKSHITWKTFKVISLIQCRLCNLQYIGETKRRLKDRFNGHRRPILNPTGNYIDTAVSERFLTSNHSYNHMLLIPIEKLKNGRDSLRKARDAHLIHKAKTIEPLGINKLDELSLYLVYLLFFCYLVF